MIKAILLQQTSAVGGAEGKSDASPPDSPGKVHPLHLLMVCHIGLIAY